MPKSHKNHVVKTPNLLHFADILLFKITRFCQRKKIIPQCIGTRRGLIGRENNGREFRAFWLVLRSRWNFVASLMEVCVEWKVVGKVLYFNWMRCFACWHTHMVIVQRSFKGKILFRHISIDFQYTFVLKLLRKLASWNWTACNNLRRKRLT